MASAASMDDRFAFSGLCLAIGHHVYYSKLDHTPAGNEGRQQWAHTFGNIFAVSVATLFAVANRLAYKQCFWTIVRRKSFTLKALDSLFSLTSDLLGFWIRICGKDLRWQLF